MLEDREGRALVTAIHERKRKADMTDQLAAIEARAEVVARWREHFHAPQSNIDYSQRDVPALLALARKQAAQIERVLDLATTRSRCGWQISADEIRKALTATEGA
jgi:lysyl-tRNA synthetase class I